MDRLVPTVNLELVGSQGLLDSKAAVVQLDLLELQETMELQDQLVQPANLDQQEQTGKLDLKVLKDNPDH